MNFTVSFTEDYKLIEVDIRNTTIRCDNSIVKGGSGLAPNPGTYLFTSIGSCVAATAYSYCHRNKLPLPTGVSVQVDFAQNDSGPTKISFDIQLPADFPENRTQAVRNAADACWVKKQWLDPPQFEMIVRKDN